MTAGWPTAINSISTGARIDTATASSHPAWFTPVCSFRNQPRCWRTSPLPSRRPTPDDGTHSYTPYYYKMDVPVRCVTRSHTAEPGNYCARVARSQATGNCDPHGHQLQLLHDTSWPTNIGLQTEMTSTACHVVYLPPSVAKARGRQ